MHTVSTYQIEFQPVGKRITTSPGISLLEMARQAGIELTSICGGEGNCGQCRVKIVAGEVSRPNSDEEFIIDTLDLLNGERLACCVQVESDVTVVIPKSSLLTNSQLQVTSEIPDIAVDPLVTAYAIEIPPPSLQDARSDIERVIQAISATGSSGSFFAEPAVIRQVSEVARKCEWRISAYVRDTEIIGVVPKGMPPLGMAIDLGTTKIAAFLLDLETGEELASAGTLNPQIGYGGDVISRLNYAHRKEDGARILAEMIYEALDDLLEDLIRRAGVERRQVAEICVVGNTAMTHLLLQIPTRQLSTTPYVASASIPLDVKARELHLETAPGAYAHVLPCIGGFVGADHVAMLLATSMDCAQHTTVGIDIGTNTEIALARPDMNSLSSASCASGPAFEGAHISDGMRAASGAIEGVRLLETGIQLKTIDRAPPIGLCGSGIIDAIAELRRCQIINLRGRLQENSDFVRVGRHGLEVLLVPAKLSGSGRDIVLTQEDVNEIQLAKGAIRAGLDVLGQITNTAPEDVKEVIIAGAFGSFLNVESALDAGLFSYYPNAQYRQVGNAAGVGAKWALVSRAERERARRIASMTNYLELTIQSGFNRLFALGMLFPKDHELRSSRS